ncbi:YceI family protein [soil metagenome]
MRLVHGMFCAVMLTGGMIDSAAAQDVGAPEYVTYIVAAQENEARYLVREQLARVNLPNDAVGRTAAVSGSITIDAQGAVLRDRSRFTIDMTTLKSDNDRRDNYVRRNTLETDEHPAVVFVPAGFRGLNHPLPVAGELTFQMYGDLTIRGVTRPATWDVTAIVANGRLRGVARTSFTFDDFEMRKPRVASVLSVADDIRLEYSFHLVPAP